MSQLNSVQSRIEEPPFSTSNKSKQEKSLPETVSWKEMT